MIGKAAKKRKNKEYFVMFSFFNSMFHRMTKQTICSDLKLRILIAAGAMQPQRIIL